jgi:dihydroflavonol-4-reductase
LKKNILITGASGFIGSFLVEKALQKNYNTFAGIRQSSSKEYLTNHAIQFIELDFSNEEKLEKTLLDFKTQFENFDYIIHSAGLTKAAKKEDYFSTNCHNTERFITTLIKLNLIPSKFVYISSLASFGPGSLDNPISTNQIQQPLTAYGASKKQAEEFILQQNNLPSIIINPTAVYGPREKDFYLLLKSIDKNFEIYLGNKTQLLSFIHVDDLVDAIFLSMEADVKQKRILVSDYNAYTPISLNKIIKKKLGRKTISFTIPKYPTRALASITELIGKLTGNIPILNRERLKEFEAKNWSVNCDELKSLGFKPKYNLELGLEQTIKWYQNNGLLKKSKRN